MPVYVNRLPLSILLGVFSKKKLCLCACVVGYACCKHSSLFTFAYRV